MLTLRKSTTENQGSIQTFPAAREDEVGDKDTWIDDGNREGIPRHQYKLELYGAIEIINGW